MSVANECPRRRPGERAVGRQDGCMRVPCMGMRHACACVWLVGHVRGATCNMRGRSSCARPCAAKALQLSLAQRTRSIVAR